MLKFVITENGRSRKRGVELTVGGLRFVGRDLRPAGQSGRERAPV